MLSEHTLRHALERIGERAPVRFDEVTDSTNRTALRLASAGAPEWTLVAAAHQTAGRGRLGRAWVDEPGRALMFSVVLRPELPAERTGLVSLLAGAAAAAACREVAGVEAGCKWPNDLLVDRRKAGGILAETRLSGARLDHVVLGVGINLGEPPAAVPEAGSVGDVDPVALLGAFLESFHARYQPTHPAFPGAVLAAYRDVCVTLGRRVGATTVEGRTVDGHAIDLDEHGGLMVETGSGLELVAFGDVEHLDS